MKAKRVKFKRAKKEDVIIIPSKHPLASLSGIALVLALCKAKPSRKEGKP